MTVGDKGKGVKKGVARKRGASPSLFISPFPAGRGIKGDGTKGG